MLAVPAGRDIPAAGEGGGKKKRPRGFLPAAPGGSCRTDVATAGGDTPHLVPSRTARALGNADPGGADVPTAGPTPPQLEAELPPPPGRCAAGGGSSPGAWGGCGGPQARSRLAEGLDTQGHSQGRVSSPVGTWLEAAGAAAKARLCFPTRGRFAAPGWQQVWQPQHKACPY